MVFLLGKKYVNDHPRWLDSYFLTHSECVTFVPSIHQFVNNFFIIFTSYYF